MDHEIKLTTPGGDGATKHQKIKWAISIILP